MYKQIEQTGQAARILTFEKSRSGRGGTQLLMKQQKDLSYTVEDWTPEVDPTNASPSGVTDRVLQRLRLTKVPRTLKELQSDPICGGSNAAVKKSLQRLLKRGLLREAGRSLDSQTKRWNIRYEAVLSSTRVVVGDSVHLGVNPSTGTGSEGGQSPEMKGDTVLDSQISAKGTKGDTMSSDSEGCPSSLPLQQQGSPQMGTLDRSIRAGACEDGEPTFSDEQKMAAMKQALSKWT